ncbi:MAG: hypothetical protein PHE15_02510 [Dehalococcoidales bacterium]|nr:hypothetical protein [Dehalococcoidales bacterium]
MDDRNDEVEYAASHTRILRLPEQKLSTFGQTVIRYYVVTEPVYADLSLNTMETVLRQGRIIAEKPRIVTPYYLSRLEGFSLGARMYFNKISQVYGPSCPGLYYTYRNEPGELSIIPENIDFVVNRINDYIEKNDDRLVAIIQGQDHLWDVSLMKFIYEITQKSIYVNLTQLQSQGLMDVDAYGIPLDAKMRIEQLFKQLVLGKIDPAVLKKELQYWDLFEDYQDRFFATMNIAGIL